MSKLFEKEDVITNNAVRWCPGCGNFSILSAMHHALPLSGVKLEDIVFITGIGCSSRFVYYINSYGFHTIHGRATAVASGVKMANPNLSVWVVTGDGDGMAIGGNHLMHLLRRNLDINILLFNNKVYGLTKGQYSPTSDKGTQTKSSPFGVIEEPINIGEFAIAAGATFYARVLDSDVQTLKQVMLEASAHKGTALIEILQNCVIFADKIHQDVASKELRDEHTILLEAGKPMLFGKNKEFGFRLNGLSVEVVKPGVDGISIEDILIHTPQLADSIMQTILVKLARPTFPLVLGVVRSVDKPVYEDELIQQIDEEKKKSGIHTMTDLLHSSGIIRL